MMRIRDDEQARKQADLLPLLDRLGLRRLLRALGKLLLVLIVRNAIFGGN